MIHFSMKAQKNHVPERPVPESKVMGPQGKDFKIKWDVPAFQIPSTHWGSILPPEKSGNKLLPFPLVFSCTRIKFNIIFTSKFAHPKIPSSMKLLTAHFWNLFNQSHLATATIPSLYSFTYSIVTINQEQKNIWNPEDSVLNVKPVWFDQLGWKRSLKC